MFTSRLRLTFLAALIHVWPLTAYAQSPVTGPLSEGEPPAAAYRLGPVDLTPNFLLRELGVDDNVFDDPENPQGDFMIVAAPDLAAYLRSGFAQFVVNAGTEFTYYQEFASERAVSAQFRGRMDLLLSRFRPSLAVAWLDTQTRPNQEIDLRADRREREISGTVAFEVSPIARAYVGVSRIETDYDEDQVYRGTDLDDSLSRRVDRLRLGMRFAVTPLTTVSVEAQTGGDRFAVADNRDSDSRSIAGLVTFAPDAIVSGSVRLGYRDFQPRSLTVPDFKGLIMTGTLTAVGFWRGRLTGLFERDVQYSYEESDDYFVSTFVDVIYTQRVLGPLDVQVRGARGLLDYADPIARTAREDTTRTYAGGVGYNLESGTRFGVSYEHAERESPERPDRRYSRRKVYASFAYSF